MKVATIGQYAVMAIADPEYPQLAYGLYKQGSLSPLLVTKQGAYKGDVALCQVAQELYHGRIFDTDLRAARDTSFVGSQ